jgi:probable HAF family extracellular repeat protein
MRLPRPVTLALLCVSTACGEAPTLLTPPGHGSLGRAASGPTVSEVNPGSGTQGTTLDVHVLGSGFDRGSSVGWLISGVPTAEVRTNSVRYVGSGELIANITISADAEVSAYDVQVTTGGGKKGIGVEKFGVTSVKPLDTGAGGGAAYNLNDAGWAVGYSYSVVSSRSATLWRPGAPPLLLPNLGVGSTVAGDISSPPLGAAPVIVGWLDAKPFTPYAWTSADGGQSWSITPLTIPSGLHSAIATAVGETGTIVGYAYINGSDGYPDSARAVRWNGTADAAPEVLSYPGGTFTYGYDVNSQGDVAVTIAYGGGKGDALLWRRDGSYRLLPTYADYSNHHANAISDGGVIVGSAQTRRGVTRAIRWVPNATLPAGYTVQDIGPGVASAVNELGQVVGTYTDGGTAHAFVWSAATGMEVLDPLPGWHESSALGINDPRSGTPQVAGYSRSSSLANDAMYATVWAVP